MTSSITCASLLSLAHLCDVCVVAETSFGKEQQLVSIDLTKDESSSGKEEEEAAVRIQAAFRGHKVRTNIMKQPANQSEPEPTQQELEAEFRADDVGEWRKCTLFLDHQVCNVANFHISELCHAATRIQASFRGHMARKQIDKKDEDESEPSSRVREV